MKKLSILLIISFCLLPAGIARADKEQAAFAIQKAKVYIEQVKAKGDDQKASPDGLKRASAFIAQAEATLKDNTSILGKLKKEAEPDIFFYTEMAEISAAIFLSRMEQGLQEKENARLEKIIPEIEAKIKIFNDKDAEIKRLTEELKKPRGSLDTLNSEVIQLKKEKSDLTEQLSRLKQEQENLNRKLALDAQAQLQSLNRELDYRKELEKLDYLMKTSKSGWYTFIIPRRELIKTAAKGPVLAYDAEKHLAKFADLMKAFPDHKLKLIVYGFGNPPKQENNKATETMAKLLKDMLVKNGVKESSIAASGAGSELPLFSKGAVEENRRVEVTLSPLQKP